MNFLKPLPFLFLATFLHGEGKFYDPVTKDVEGWTIKVDPALLKCPNEQLGKDALKALANHLQRVKIHSAGRESGRTPETTHRLGSQAQARKHAVPPRPGLAHG